MPQQNSDEAANDEPTTYNVEECEDERRWDETLNDIKVDLVGDLDRDSRSTNNNKSHGHGESSNKDRLERDPRDEIKGPGRPNFLYPSDIGSIVSGLHPTIFPNGGLQPNSKVQYPYSVPYQLLYGASPSSDIESKTGMHLPHHPDIPPMYSLPGQLGQVPHPLAPWPAPPLYPICTASTAAMAASMLRYPHPFAFTSSAAAAVASNMPRFPLAPPHPHGPGMHPTMIPHPALVSNGPLGNMGNGQHPHHGKHDHEKSGRRHSKSESEHGRPKRDRPYVKKPLNAFMLYMKEQRAKVVAECTLKESAAINQILGRKWHSLSREEQQKYYEMARKERQLHLQLYPGWSARDNYGKRKKRKKEKSQGECTDPALSGEKSYASLASEHFYGSATGSTSNMYYELGSRFSHYSPPCNYGNHNTNSNNASMLKQTYPQCNSSFWSRHRYFDDSPFSRNAESMCLPEKYSHSFKIDERRKKKCIRYQHDDDSEDDDLSPDQSPQYPGFPNQSNPFDSMRSSSPLSITSQSANGSSDYSAPKSTSSRLPGNQVSPLQQGMLQDIKQEFRTSPVGLDGHVANGGKNFDPYTSRDGGRAPSSDNSYKSEGSPHSQGGDSNGSHGNGSAHRRPNENSNNNNSREGRELNFSRSVANGNHSQNTVHRQASVPSGGESRSNFRKTNSLDGGGIPSTSGLGGRNPPSGSMSQHNTSGTSNASADSPGSSHSRTQQGHRNSSSGLNKLSNGSSTSHLPPHPSPLHPPSTGLFLPPHSPSYNHPSPHATPFMPPYSPYLTPGMLAAFGAPPSPISSLMLSSFKGISPSSMGGPNPGSSGHVNQARVTPGAVVEGKS